MNDATLDLDDVTGLTGVALLFAYDSLKEMSDRALRQGNRKQFTHLYSKWQEVAKEVEKRDLIGAYTQIKLLDLKLQQAHTQPRRVLNQLVVSCSHLFHALFGQGKSATNKSPPALVAKPSGP